MTTTATLRDVMKESISARRPTCARARLLRHQADAFETRDIHVDVPTGRPRRMALRRRRHGHRDRLGDDGIPVRRDLAMTGEIMLRGHVWPIAGLKEKLLAALRGGIKTVLIPEENAKDLVEIAEASRAVSRSSRSRAWTRARPCDDAPARADRVGEMRTTPAAAPEEAPVEGEVTTLTAHRMIATQVPRRPSS